MTKPTIKEIYERMITNYENQTGEKLPLISPDRIQYIVIAGAIWLLWGFLEYIFSQFFINKAEGKYLEYWCEIFEIQRKEAAYASGSITVTGIQASVIPVNTKLIGNNKVEYISLSEYTIPVSGEIEVNVKAAEKGFIGDLPGGEKLNLITPISGVDTEANVIEITGGTDQETDEEMKTRLLFIIQNPGHGGTTSDYIRWTMEVPGVTRAWCYDNYLGPGTVGITFLTEKSSNRIPNQTKIDEVQSYVSDKTRKPVLASPHVFTLLEKNIDITITELAIDTPEIRVSIQDVLSKYLLSLEPETIIYPAHLDDEITKITGGKHVMQIPDLPITNEKFEVPKLGSITWPT